MAAGADVAGADLRASMAQLPRAPGVYRFRDTRGRVMYVGRATDLRSRVRSYWGDLQGRRHLRRMVPQVTQIEALACASVHEAAWLERNLLERSLPRWNRMRGGADVAVWVALDERPRQAGLALTHDTADPGLAYFGPYLGADKAARLVGALRRLAPIDSARVGLAGSERAMASARGVTPGHREALIAKARAILDRDEAAIALAHDELLARRARASADLAFEAAGRITAEIEALTWASGVQRVTTGGGDAAAHAWADGVLLSLEVSGGRMNRWRQRPLGEAAARRHLASTPPEWVEFARINAELAARLRGRGVGT